MATAVERTDQKSPTAVLHGVSFKEYARLTRLDANSHLRMAYWDGTLEIMSPKLNDHDHPARRIGVIITTVTGVLDLPYDGTGSFRKSGSTGPNRGRYAFSVWKGQATSRSTRALPCRSSLRFSCKQP